jgi:phosphatidylinositol alpha 1,6-mannosyltransferase
MRILYCTDTYPPQVNGVSVVTAASVAGMLDRRWDCAVINPRYPKPYGVAFESDRSDLASVAIHEKIPSIPFPLYPDIRLAAPNYGRVREIVRRFRPDLIHCQTEFIIGKLGQHAATEFGVPLVSSYHTDFSRYTESYGVPWLRPTVTRYIARFHSRSRRVYTPSEPARGDLARMGVAQVEVWGRGVDVRQFSPERRDVAVRTSLKAGDAFVFLHVGRLAAEKNVHVIVEAYERFTAANPRFDSVLVIAGAGPVLSNLRATAPAGVMFMGNLDRHGVLPSVYASADAFVYASETETLGLVVLEAMASGLPVVATPAGGVADNLRDGENGLAFPPGDAAAMATCMERIAFDPDLRRRLASNARAWAERKSWEAELNRLDESYREVAGGLVTAAAA